MTLKRCFITAVLAAASAVVAIPIDAAAVEQYPGSASTSLVQQNFDDRMLLDTWQNEQGTFSIWGSAPDAAINITETIADPTVDGNSALARRHCRSPHAECDKKNTASLQVCKMLVGSLEDSRKNEWIHKSPQDYCLQSDRGKCCVSWRTPITSTVRMSELAGAGNMLLRECHDGRGKISGRVLNAEIGEFCSVQCLSNRPRRC
ncbi:hypothetical protein CSOJ01_13786 [Colletotrichum sojae]|uniref:WD-like domain-containing protein n=1 Tax=Colletotrichum sojae TaxID=2175907 RepID=A0A8H6MJW0_9PEZI|nr:hypothetical protein CSOJ01_13786 [Colletotrichum sojae]